MSGNHRKRLERIEQKLSDLVNQEELVTCICRKHVFVGTRENFLSEMNKTCPVHGFRRFGLITFAWPRREDRRGNLDGPLPGLQEAIEEYYRLRAQVQHAENEKGGNGSNPFFAKRTQEVLCFQSDALALGFRYDTKATRNTPSG
jgi:hypothetical protein